MRRKRIRRPVIPPAIGITLNPPFEISCPRCGRCMCFLATIPHGGHFETVEKFRMACPDDHCFDVPTTWIQKRFAEAFPNWGHTFTRMTVPQRYETA